MKAQLTILVCLVSLCGCESLHLRNHAVQQASTLSDIHSKQVLNNFAMLYHEPDAVPFFSLANKGITTIQMTGTATAGINWDYVFFGLPGHFANHADKKSLGVTGTEQDINTWNTDSILDPDRLQLMRCAYQKAIGFRCPDPACDDVLARFFKNEPNLLAPMMHPGWVHFGKIVPPNACHVGRHGTTFAWVMANDLHQLSLFTLAMLDIATVAVERVQPEDAAAKHQAKIKSMSEQIKLLTEIFQKLPAETADQKKTKDSMATRIALELDQLFVEYNHSKDSTDAKIQAFKLRASKLLLPNNNEHNALIESAIRNYADSMNSQSTAPGPVLRPRREFTGPAIQNVVPLP